HHGETLSLSADFGEDPAWLHQSTEQETKELAVHLFRGHYTSGSATIAGAAFGGKYQDGLTSASLFHPW
ncbi:MAG: hypothetical protein LC799_08990, partial [Actinobacteria bacterium]|nr:hypothetical protein [Actinomycetota bacterium]